MTGVIFWLETRSGDAVDRLPLEGDQVTLGRSAINHIVLASDAQASRVHAALLPCRLGWIVRDLGSRNGTFVNHRRVEADRLLRDGDELVVGSTQLTVRAQARSPHQDDLTTTLDTHAVQSRPLRRQSPVRLSARELQVVALVADGHSNAQIAAQLHISEHTAAKHVGNILGKLELHSRVQLVRWALEHGAASPPR